MSAKGRPPADKNHFIALDPEIETAVRRSSPPCRAAGVGRGAVVQGLPPEPGRRWPGAAPFVLAGLVGHGGGRKPPDHNPRSSSLWPDGRAARSAPGSSTHSAWWVEWCLIFGSMNWFVAVVDHHPTDQAADGARSAAQAADSARVCSASGRQRKGLQRKRSGARGR
jgi:hypothetical protein